MLIVRVPEVFAALGSVPNVWENFSYILTASSGGVVGFCFYIYIQMKK